MHLDPPQHPPVTPAGSVMEEKEARWWAMACHLSALLGCWVPFGSIIAPLIIWQIKRDQHPMIDRHGKESVNFQITIYIYGIIAFVLCMVFIGFLLLPLVMLAFLILTIVAGLKASNGEHYRYPMTIRLLK